MPHKVSELSSNVMFKDMDTDKHEEEVKHEPTTKYQRSQKKTEPVQPPLGEKASMGVLTNAFMGATTRYQKPSIDYSLLTPTKQVYEEHGNSPKNSETSSQSSHMKFTRRKQA